MATFIKFTKEDFKTIPIDYVREIGREIGVKSPTSKKKETIIDEIIAIQDGQLEPVPLSKRGAPVKMALDLKKFYIPEEVLYPNRFKSYAEMQGFDEQKSYDEALRIEEERVRKEFGLPEPKEEEPTGYAKYANENSSKIFLNDSATAGWNVTGFFEPHPQGFGFLRVHNCENSKDDAYISPANIKKYNIRCGDRVSAFVKFNQEGTSAAVQEVCGINGELIGNITFREHFDNLIPCYPTQRMKLESEGQDNTIAMRCVDLFSPIGMGQRGLIVAPPKTGKTTLLKMLAKSIENNYPDVKVIVLLIDERPEEVTDIRRSIAGDVIYSTFDETPEHHVRVSELVINYAKRLVEMQKDVVILLDSITRLARAYNSTVESSGKVLSGGLDPAALQGPKRFFGAARNIEEGGSLTILATALTDTGSRMDDVVYEEFKGTGNMEIYLSRELSEKRIFPAIDLYKSGTRKEEMLLKRNELSLSKKLRKILADKPDATDSLLGMLKKTKSNAELGEKIDEWLKIYGKKK